MLLLLLTKVKSLERNIVCLNTQNNLFKRKTNTNSFMTSNWRGATGSQTKVSFRIFFSRSEKEGDKERVDDESAKRTRAIQREEIDRTWRMKTKLIAEAMNEKGFQNNNNNNNNNGEKRPNG